MLRLPKSPEEKRIATELAVNGLSVGEPYTDTGMKRATLCLIRGLLVFLSTFGTIGGITAAFGLPFNVLTVGLALFAISVFICFTYYNKVTFYTGYIIMFLAFMVMYVFAYAYINSGFQAFLNEVYKAYSDFFVLPSTRETTEYVAERSLTVPAAMLFTGAGFAILLNISISAYMDLFTTFLLTFLPLQVAFYIDIVPPMPYLVMIITVYITVEVLSRSGRFRLPYRYKKGRQFAVVSQGNDWWRIGPLRRKKTVKYEYLASGSGMIQLSAVSAVIATAMMLILSGMFSGQFKTKYVSNGVKDVTDGYVKMLAQGGITSLFNRYSATGGLSHGKLGGISSVTPDYETDIVVRMVPTSTGENEGGMNDGRLNGLYLKAYTGVYYTKDQFMAAIPGKIGETELISLDDYIPIGANYMDTDHPAYMKLWLMSPDADNTYDYRPYYTLFSDSRRNVRSTGVSDKVMRYAVAELGAPEEAEKDREAMAAWVDEMKEDPESQPTNYELIYIPYTEGVPYYINPTITDKYEKSVYDNYLDIPEDISLALTLVAEDAGLNKIGTDTRLDRLEIMQRLKEYFKEEYTYSMMPGTTPINRDTVEYFLTELKRGYCVHFAASSTLILRSMGIPARYVEGYVVNPSDIIESSGFRAPATDWILGDGPDPSDEIAVVDVEIPDANAHAWTEVYIDGYGWIPYDFTPPSEDEDLQLGGIADFFARLFSSTERNAGDNDTGVTIPDTSVANASGWLANSRFAKFFKSMDFFFGPFLIVAGIIFGVIVLIWLFNILRNRYHLSSLLKTGNPDEALLIHYRDMLRYLHSHGVIDAPYPTVSEVADALKKAMASDENTTDISGAEAGGGQPEARTADIRREDVDKLADVVSPEDIDKLADVVSRAAFGSEHINQSEYVQMRDLMHVLVRMISKKRRF